MKDKKAITLKTLTKSNVWDIQENDVFRMWEAAEKDADLKDNMRRYTDIIRSAFEVEDIKIDRPEIIKKYEDRGFKTGAIRIDENNKQKIAIKKRPIMRVTDLTYENIRHISAAKLVEVLDRNFGGGWDSLSQSIQDIIKTGFDISTTTLPKDRLHQPGGLYEKKINDGYEVLEIAKGLWIEAIFAKEKPELDSPKMRLEAMDDLDEKDEDLNEDVEEELEEDDFQQEEEEEEEDDTFDDDKLTEESYRTTYDENPDELNYEAEEISDDNEF
jgi:hypothetical protein